MNLSGWSILSRALMQATGRSCLFRIERAGLRDCGGAVPSAQSQPASAHRQTRKRSWHEARDLRLLGFPCFHFLSLACFWHQFVSAALPLFRPSYQPLASQVARAHPRNAPGLLVSTEDFSFFQRWTDRYPSGSYMLACWVTERQHSVCSGSGSLVSAQRRGLRALQQGRDLPRGWSTCTEGPKELNCS